MENGQGLAGEDVDEVAMQAAAVLAGGVDGRKEMMMIEKGAAGEEDDVVEEEEEEEEDVYSMDVSDKLEKRGGIVAKQVVTAMAAVASELDMNDSPKEEDVTMTSMRINNEPGSASEAATEIQTAAAVLAAAASSGKEDVRDLNEAPTLELENESEEVATANEASPTPMAVERVFLQAAEVPEVAQEAPGKDEMAIVGVVERAVVRPALDVKEALEAVKIVEEMHSDVAAFRIVKAGEAKSLHDMEDKMVGYMPGGEREAFRAVVHRESVAELVANDSKGAGEASARAEEPSGSQSRPNTAMAAATGVVVDAKEGVSEGLALGAERTELEREMELYEAAEREEQARLLGPMRVEQQREEPYREPQNEKKRALDMPMPERQRKLSRKIQLGDEKKKDEEDVCFICFDGGDLVLCDRRYGAFSRLVECVCVEGFSHGGFDLRME